MAYDTILLEKKDHIATLTLNRPERLNALNDQAFHEVNAAIKDVAMDSSVRVFIITGAGRAFCASGDVKDERQGGDRLFSERTAYEGMEFTRGNPQLVTLGLQKLPMPTIAMVNGLAIGTGFDWVLACDIRIGCEHSKFMNAFIQMGLPDGAGGTWLAPKALGINKALELLYTGEWLEAQEAFRLGVLNRLVTSAKLLDETMALAKKIAERAPIPQRLVKDLVYRGVSESLEQHLPAAAAAVSLTMKTADHKEALEAFNAKRRPVFRGK